jgi:hypothetical protein
MSNSVILGESLGNVHNFFLILVHPSPLCAVFIDGIWYIEGERNWHLSDSEGIVTKLCTALMGS